MDLSTLTPEQRACVTCVDRPLLVSAGAGSGKTFMLTKRIAYALLHPELSGATGIDRILAITFTDKAASEIKARVRSTLRAEGLVEQALAVDASWIGTIHGTCSRILHEHALELGLDPQFGLLDDTDRSALLREAINEVIDEVSAREGDADGEGEPADPTETVITERRFAALFSEYEGASGESVVGSMVEQLVNDAANVRDGLDGVQLGPEPASPRDILHDVLDALEEVRYAATQLLSDPTGHPLKKPPAWATKMLERIEGEGVLDTLATLAERPTLGYEDVAEALGQLNLKVPTYTTPKTDPERRRAIEGPNVRLRLRFDAACHECALGLTRIPLRQLLELAREAQARFDAKKRQRNVLDQNDLLLETLRALDANVGGIADEYRDRFALVMVDEFQDTSALQIAIIGHLDGTNHERLCTVGDKQQSIYRFRGASVETFDDFQRQMGAQPNARREQLGKNWRSHGAIIEFVNRVFSQPEAFGTDDFIQLAYDEGHEQANPFWPDVPRIDIVLASSPRKGGPSSLERRSVEARAIARRFRQLHDDAGGANRRWGDMVILLGSMTRSDIYAQALRDEGIPCVVAGGSTFGNAPEAQTICQLASAVANPLDDAALGAVLESGMFGLSPDELLRLATRPGGATRGFWEGLEVAGADDPSPRVRLAAGVIREAVARAGRDDPARILGDAVLSSGWLDRLRGAGGAGQVDEQGMAVAANVLKALRLVEGFQADPQAPRSMASVAARLRTKFAEGMKEAPGALNTTGQDAVRLMTIHASKGLEFPIVALAEFVDQKADRDKLAIETAGETLLVSLVPGRSFGDEGAFAKLGEHIKKDYPDQLKRARSLVEEGICPEAADIPGAPVAAGGDPCEAEGAAAFARLVRERARTGELAEMRRKAYVGMTRPREALIIAAHPWDRSDKVREEHGGAYYPDVLDDVRRAIVGTTADLQTAPGCYTLGKVYGQPDPIWPACAPHGVRVGCEHLRGVRDEAGHVTLSEVNLADGEVGELPLEEYLGTGDAGELAGAEGSAGTGGRAAEAVPTALVPEYVCIDDVRPVVQPSNSLQAGLISYSYLAPTHEAHPCDADETPRGKRAAYVSASDGDADEEIPQVTDAPQAEGDAGERDAGIEDPAGEEDAPASSATPDPTAFGSAFHAAAQWMVEQLMARRDDDARSGADGRPAGDVSDRDASPARLSLPDEARLRALARTWGLAANALPRLDAALRRWVGSDVAREALAHPRLLAEAPIFSHVDAPTGEPLYLNGSIDLLCLDAGSSGKGENESVGAGEGAARSAFVVDYKTGSPDETSAQLAEKHLLQASCYALAVLESGFEEVAIAFVRVEQADPARPDQPQVVRYAFDRTQTRQLIERIQAAYLAKRSIPPHA